MTTSTSVPPPLPLQESPALSSGDRTLAALCHVSTWLNIFAPGLGFVMPLIILLVMRDQSRFVAENAKESMNFQLSMLIYFICAIPLFLVFIGVPILLGVIGLGLICPLIATIRAADGTLSLYPFTIRFV
jgi:uncharacterized Tic20 family protein